MGTPCDRLEALSEASGNRPGDAAMSILCGFTGTLTADAINRTSSGGKNWTALNVRVGTGQQTQWCNVAVFGDEAGAVAPLKEGAAVYIEGRLELRRWENH